MATAIDFSSFSIPAEDDQVRLQLEQGKKEEQVETSKENKTRKRRSKVSIVCPNCNTSIQEEVNKKQRSFKWTEENAKAFEKCQTSRRNNQAVVTAKKQLSSVLGEMFTTVDEAEKAILQEKVNKLESAYFNAVKVRDEFKSIMEKERNEKKGIIKKEVDNTDVEMVEKSQLEL